MPKRLPDEILYQRQKLHRQKVAQTRQKIINYIEKYHRPNSRCSICDRKGSVLGLTRESVNVRCAKCKKVWIFKKRFSKAFLPKALFAKPKRKINKEKIVIIKSTPTIPTPTIPTPISKRNKEKQERKILQILKGNIEIKLSTSS